METLLAFVGRPRNEILDLIKVLFFISLFIFLYWQARRRNRDRALELSALARRWGGGVVSGGLFGQPRLEIRVEGEPAEVTFHAADRFKSKWTKIHVNWPCPGRLRVTPEGFTKWMRSMFGGGDIKVGDEAFDKKFWVASADPAWARAVLTPGLRMKLMGFREDYGVAFTNVITVDLGPAGLMVKVWRPLVDEPAMLEWFLQLASQILKEAQGRTAVAGIDVIALEVRGGSICPVCGQAIESGPQCHSCGTPHHEDCWTYTGGCAMFGCRGRRRAA